MEQEPQLTEAQLLALKPYAFRLISPSYGHDYSSSDDGAITIESSHLGLFPGIIHANLSYIGGSLILDCIGKDKQVKSTVISF